MFEQSMLEDDFEFDHGVVLMEIFNIVQRYRSDMATNAECDFPIETPSYPYVNDPVRCAAAKTAWSRFQYNTCLRLLRLL